jgi:hypothetical protein
MGAGEIGGWTYLSATTAANNKHRKFFTGSLRVLITHKWDQREGPGYSLLATRA